MKLILLGDSIMHEYMVYQYPICGWGQILKHYFNEKVEFYNLGVPKMSTRTCMEYGVFDKALELADNESYAVINFGHNDKLVNREERYVTSTKFKQNLNYMIDELEKRGTKVILATPTNIVKLDENNNLIYDNHGDYPEKIREVASERNIPLVDFYKETYDLFKKTGYPACKRFVMMFEPGEYQNYPEGQNDSHLRPDGAFEVARMFAKALVDINHPLAKFMYTKNL